jgi:hypothetical protein
MAYVPVVQLLISSTALGLCGYLFYKALTTYVDDPVDNAKKVVSTTDDYYASDQLTHDVQETLSPVGEITIRKIDTNLYDVMTGMGSWIRMDDKGVNTLINQNNRSNKVVFMK